MKKRTKHKAWTQMTTAELAKATKRFDKPIGLEDTRPLSPANRKRWERSRRHPVYSLHVYSGKTRTLRIQVDDALLRQFDEFAKRNNMTRDEFITRSLRSALAFVA